MSQLSEMKRKTKLQKLKTAQYKVGQGVRYRHVSFLGEESFATGVIVGCGFDIYGEKLVYQVKSPDVIMKRDVPEKNITGTL